jgi:hypothetical protein
VHASVAQAEGADEGAGGIPLLAAWRQLGGDVTPSQLLHLPIIMCNNFSVRTESDITRNRTWVSPVRVVQDANHCAKVMPIIMLQPSSKSSGVAEWTASKSV